MTADALPTWQINGVVFSQVVVGTTVYVTGSFTKARPPGVPAGDPSEVDAANIFAFDITTGERVASFNHALNAQGLVVKASPDGSRVYVGGDFSTVDGISRGHVAAFNTATNALVTNWAPNVGGQVRGFGITADTVYVGGNFPSANAETRTSLAAFNVTNSQIKPWAPTAEGTGGYVWTMTMSPDNSRVIVGGSFSTLNLQPAYGMGSLDATTGAVMPWAANERIRTAGLNGGITSLRSDGTQIYGSGYAYGTGATFEGTFAADPLTGTINWVNDCLGDEYDTYVLSGAMYSVGHVHNCTVIGQFPDTSPRSRWQKALAAPITATGTTTVKDAYGWDYRGLPYAGLLHWYPDLEFGSYTPDRQAAWSITGAGDYLVLGGEFPIVNNVAQQGLVRFALPASSPKASKPIYSTTLTPTASSIESGNVKLRWQTTWDRDDPTLTYDVYRDGGPAIATLTSDSIFWRLPYLSWTDTGQTPGTSHTYKIRARDKDGNVQWSLSSAAVTVLSGMAQAMTTTTPAIAGRAQVGNSLTVSVPAWGPTPVALAYQWSRSGTDVPGATTSSYVLAAADAGQTVTVTVTGTRAGYLTTSATSEPTSKVLAGALVPTPTPTLSGTAKVGYALTATPGTWGPAPVVLTYRWYRVSSTGVVTAITGATASKYVMTASDKAYRVKVTVTGSKAGYTSVARTSVVTASVVAGTLTSATPSISGTAKVGYALTATPGTWGPAPVVLTYRWYRVSSTGVVTAITGATASKYVMTASDKAYRVKVTVTGSKAGYTSVARTSVVTASVVAGTLTSATPSISGTAKVGYALTATPAPGDPHQSCSPTGGTGCPRRVWSPRSPERPPRST